MNYYVYTFKTTIKYLNRYPSYWFWMFLRAMYVAAEVAQPILLGQIVNQLATNQTSWAQLQWTVLPFIGFFLFGPMIEVLTAGKAWFIGTRAATDFRKDTINMLKHAGLSFWQHNNKGAVMRIIDKSYESVNKLSAMMSHSYLWTLGRMIGIFTATIFITPFVLLVLVFDAILFCVNLYLLMRKEQKRGDEENKASEKVSSGINEYLQNYKTVVYLNLYKRLETDLAQRNEEAYYKYSQREKISMLKWYNDGQLHSLSVLVIFGICLWQVLSGNLTVGALTTIMFFIMSVAQSLSNLVWQSEEFLRYVNHMQRYYEVFHQLLHNKNKTEKVSIISHNQFETLSVQQISVQRQEVEALNNVSFELEHGEKMAIVGYTGSGKSTLLDVILKVITDFNGTININGYNYQDIEVQDMTNFFSIVPQEVQLFKDSIRNNILLDTIYSEDELNKLIKITNLESLINKLPEGINSIIHEGSANISGGERQRIGIARALAQNRPILVLDEATASLDPKTEREVITNVVEHYPTISIIYVTHKYSLLNYFDHILVLNEGKIVEQGSFEKLKNAGGLFNDLYKASQN